MADRNSSNGKREEDSVGGLAVAEQSDLAPVSMDEEKTPEKVVKTPSYFKKFEKWVKQIKEGERVAIFTHRSPDPDAIGAMMGLVWLFTKYKIEAECFFTGSVSHPQNMAMVNLLDPGLKPVEDYDADNFQHRVIVDCVPNGDNAAIGDETPDRFGLVLDHHKVASNNGFKGTCINLKNGSTCSIVYGLIKHSGFGFEEDNSLDSKVATGLMVGIATDTDNLLVDSCTEFEFDAYWHLFEFRDANAAKEIIKFKRPKFWITRKASASTEAIIGEDGVAVVGIGLLPERHFNLIADMADEMIQWASVETAICFAIVDGKNLVGSVRSINSSVNVSTLCQTLGGKYGTGGGRDGKGSYCYSIQGLAIEEDEDEETKKEMWDTINHKETKRIFKLGLTT